MPDIAPDLKAACSDLFPGSGIELDQLLGHDLDALRARPRAREAAAGAPEPSGHGIAEEAAQFAAADGSLPVPTISRCLSLHPAGEGEQSQWLAPDMTPPRAIGRTREAARDASGRFAKGHSGNPRGRPPGIPQPRRRPLALLLRQARPRQLAEMFDRKPALRLPLMNLLLPKPRRPDPGKLLRIDFSRMRSAAEIAAAMKRVVDAVCRGEITPGEGALLARRARQPLRALRQLMRRQIALLKAQRRAAKPAAPDPVEDPAASGGRGVRAPGIAYAASVAGGANRPARLDHRALRSPSPPLEAERVGVRACPGLDPGWEIPARLPMPTSPVLRSASDTLSPLKGGEGFASTGPLACVISAPGLQSAADRAFRRHLSSVFRPRTR